MLSSCLQGQILSFFFFFLFAGVSVTKPNSEKRLFPFSAARLVSSVQAVMATSAGYIIASSCEDIIEDQ